MIRVLAALGTALLAPAAADVQVTVPGRSPRVLERSYGKPQPVELEQIAYNGASYQKQNVITRGVLTVLVEGRYLSLSRGAAEVMIVPMDGNAFTGLKALAGHDVDLTGIVRVLPSQQTTGRCGTESECDDPLLPGLPNYQPDLPHVSITAFTASDRGTGMSAGRESGRTLADTGLEAAAADGKPVRAIGQFRGANLCHDLADSTRQDPADWVLLTSEGPVWVTGHRAEGKGFRLDPAYRRDTARWLEVSGRVQATGAVRYLKASGVAIVARPPEAEQAPCPP